MFLTKFKTTPTALVTVVLVAGARVLCCMTLAAAKPRGDGAMRTSSEAESDGLRKLPEQQKQPEHEPVDLTNFDRTIRKEPFFRTKPRYALLALGPKEPMESMAVRSRRRQRTRR